MSEIMNEEPVFMLNDKKYIISEMSDVQKMLVSELNFLEQDLITTRRQMDRLTLAKEGYITILQTDLEAPPEPSDDTNKKPAT